VADLSLVGIGEMLAALSQGRLLSAMSIGRVRRTLEHICWMTVDGAEWWACLSIGPAVDRAEWPI
jgi:hypothetical protein